VQEAKLAVGTSGTPDTINASASVSGNVIVVGNSKDTTRGAYAGAAHVFYKNGTTWVQTPKLLASDGAGVDYFGFSVAAFGDWVVIGAYGDDDFGQSTGSAYTFKRNDNGTPTNANDDFWQQRQKLVPPDGVAYNYFGKSLESYTLADADGLGTISYQWQRDGTNISGATSSQYVLPTTTSGDNGAQFDCIVTANSLSVTSSSAGLTVIDNNPANIAVYRNLIQGESSLLAYFPVDNDTGSTLTNVKDATHNGTLELDAP
jgi:hypothetical protein